MQKQKNEWMRQYFGVHDGKCKNCPHLIKKGYRNRNYYKCLAYGESCSEASDWRISWDACGLIEIPISPEKCSISPGMHNRVGHIRIDACGNHVSRLRRVVEAGSFAKQSMPKIR